MKREIYCSSLIFNHLSRKKENEDFYDILQGTKEKRRKDRKSEDAKMTYIVRAEDKNTRKELFRKGTKWEWKK